jgi:hypothetical protein
MRHYTGTQFNSCTVLALSEHQSEFMILIIFILCRGTAINYAQFEFLVRNKKITAFLDVAPWSLVALMMEAISTSEMSVSMYQTTRRNIPEDSHVHTRRRENLKYHLVWNSFWVQNFLMSPAREQEQFSTLTWIYQRKHMLRQQQLKGRIACVIDSIK